MHYTQPPYQRFNSSTHLDRGFVSEIATGRVGQLEESHIKAIKALEAMKELLRDRQPHALNWATTNFLGAAVASNHELNRAHQLSIKVPVDGTLRLHDVVSAEVNEGYISEIAQTVSEAGNDEKLAAAYDSLNKAQNPSAIEVDGQMSHGSGVPLYYEPLDSDTIGSRQ